MPVVGSVKQIANGVEDVENGCSGAGALNIVSGIGFLTLDVITLGAAGMAARTVFKEGELPYSNRSSRTHLHRGSYSL